MEILTKKDVIIMANEGRRLALIKAYKERKGIGLEEAKEAVDACSVPHFSQDGRNQVREYIIDKLLVLFGFEVHHSIKLLKEGINAVLENYEILGFVDPFEAVRVVISNYERLSRS